MTGEQAKSILLRMAANFPGLVYGHEFDTEEVRGSELVDWITQDLYALLPDRQLVRYAERGSPGLRYEKTRRSRPKKSQTQKEVV